MAAASHLRVVQLDESTGEIYGEGCPSCETKEGEVVELTKKLRGMARELSEMRRDKQLEAEGDRLWPLATRVFLYHGRLCGHEGNEWGWEQFELVAPKLKGSRLAGKRPEKEAKGLERCLRAVAGAHYDPWRKLRRNGSYFVYNRWNDIFGRVPGKASAFEEFIAKCPTDWKPPPGASEMLLRGIECNS